MKKKQKTLKKICEEYFPALILSIALIGLVYLGCSIVSTGTAIRVKYVDVESRVTVLEKENTFLEIKTDKHIEDFKRLRFHFYIHSHRYSDGLVELWPDSD